jgi:hypothetical protein
MSAAPRTRDLVLVPAVITLAVTVLRLVGELLHWDTRLFNRDPGGGGALVGIVWLIPVFGIWFALRLDRSGDAPASVGRSFLLALAAFLFNSVTGFLTFANVPSVLAQLAIFSLTSWIAIAIAYPGWPALWRVLLAYGLAARVPVVLVMAFSIFLGWDTHYTKPRPDFPAMGPLGLFLWTGLLPQLGIWIYMTIVGGLLFGSLAVAFQRLTRRNTPRAAAA